MLQKAGLIELADGGQRREKPYRSAAKAIRVAPELTSAGLPATFTPRCSTRCSALRQVRRAGPLPRRAGDCRLPLEKARELLHEFNAKLDAAEDESEDT